MKPFVFDLETYGDETAVPLLDKPKAPANYKDAEKIAAYLAEAEGDRRRKLALDPDCCRIVAIGCVDQVTVCPDVDVERAALVQFWDAWRDHPGTKIGYNVVGFDMPVLIQRSRLLRVPCPSLRITKYGCPGVTDLMLDLHPTGREYKSQAFWTRRFNLDVPEDKTTGADVARMVESGDWDGVVTHCLCDLAKTAALYAAIYPVYEADMPF